MRRPFFFGGDQKIGVGGGRVGQGRETRSWSACSGRLSEAEANSGFRRHVWDIPPAVFEFSMSILRYCKLFPLLRSFSSPLRLWHLALRPRRTKAPRSERRPLRRVGSERTRSSFSRSSSASFESPCSPLCSLILISVLCPCLRLRLCVCMCVSEAANLLNSMAQIEGE